MEAECIPVINQRRGGRTANHSQSSDAATMPTGKAFVPSRRWQTISTWDPGLFPGFPLVLLLV